MDAKSARIIKTAVKVAIAVLAYAYIAYKVATSPTLANFRPILQTSALLAE